MIYFTPKFSGFGKYFSIFVHQVLTEESYVMSPTLWKGKYLIIILRSFEAVGKIQNLFHLKHSFLLPVAVKNILQNRNILVTFSHISFAMSR